MDAIGPFEADCDMGRQVDRSARRSANAESFAIESLNAYHGRVQKALSAVVTAFCCFTIAAATFLALSYTVLKGLDNPRPLGVLALLMAQSALTLAALALHGSSAAFDLIVSAGAAGLIWVGWSIVASTLAGPHFEGYALVVGAASVAQGVLTLARFLLLKARHLPGI